jgi:UDP-N-acetylglucosamine acyltransferase
MSVVIHPAAIVDPRARLGRDVSIGPYAVVGEDVEIGDETTIASHAVVESGTRMGARCRIYSGACIGGDPQDLKFAGEKTYLHIGDDTIIREFCTLNRGTAESGKTVVGSNCALLAYVHIAHDCILGDHVIISNNLAMAGHVKVGNYVGIGGVVAIHQFCRIGDYAFIQAGTRILKDVVPYAIIGGDSSYPRVMGINKVGLERRGFDSERRMRIKRALKILFRQGLTVEDAMDKIREECGEDPDAMRLIDFIGDAQRGLIRMETSR